MNKAIFIGNLTRDPEMRYVDDRACCNFTVAVNRRVRAGAHPQADYIRVSAWDKLGETCYTYMSKGKKVYVEGRIRTHAYIDDRNQPRANLELIATDVEFLSPKGQQADGDPIPPNDNPPPEYSGNGGFTDVDLEETPFA